MCGEYKPREEFGKRYKDKEWRTARCYDCNKEYKRDQYHKHKEYGAEKRREYYRKNADKIKAKTKETKERYRKEFQKYKETLSCNRCGESDSACICFHHINADDKVGAINRMAGSVPLSSLMEEINKCEVLCFNCHMKEHRND